MDVDDTFETGQHIRLRLAAEPASVPVARHAVAAMIADTDTDPECRDEVVLAVSEAVSNAVVHAYADRPAAGIDVFAIRVRDQLIVTVTDRGRGLDLPALTPGMGLGMRLIRNAAEQALFTTLELGGTSVQCRFALTRDRVASAA